MMLGRRSKETHLPSQPSRPLKTQPRPHKKNPKRRLKKRKKRKKRRKRKRRKKKRRTKRKSGTRSTASVDMLSFGSMKSSRKKAQMLNWLETAVSVPTRALSSAGPV